MAPSQLIWKYILCCGLQAVSYTHLDVYKRQVQHNLNSLQILLKKNYENILLHFIDLNEKS